jgi:hypothetical protein
MTINKKSFLKLDSKDKRIFLNIYEKNGEWGIKQNF